MNVDYAYIDGHPLEQPRRRLVEGLLCLVGFVACIFLANAAISHGLPFGLSDAPAFPGGPHTVTILGLTAPAGVLYVGLSFSLRDGAQMALGKWWVLAAIVVGAGLSYLVAPSLAWASGLAFLVGELGDWLVYTPLVDRGRIVAGVVYSNTVGSFVDSLVFLWVAFGWASLHTFLWPQFALKLLMTLPVLLIVVPARVRRARAAA